MHIISGVKTQEFLRAKKLINYNSLGKQQLEPSTLKAQQIQEPATVKQLINSQFVLFFSWEV